MKISVIIPTYNRASIIAKSIQSVLDQTYPVDEIIVVNDCGTDNTNKIINAIGDSRIRYISLPENKGQSYARNYGASLAKNNWIAFQDSDTLWHTNKLAEQVKLITNKNDCQFVYSSYKRDDLDLVVPVNFNLECYSGNMLSTLLMRNTVDAPSILISKDLFMRIGGFDEYMRSLEDWDLAIRASKEVPFSFVPEPLLTSYRLGESVSVNIAAHYQYKCYIIAKHLTDYRNLNLFENIVTDTFTGAKQYNLEKQVEKMLTLYLSK